MNQMMVFLSVFCVITAAAQAKSKQGPPPQKTEMGSGPSEGVGRVYTTPESFAEEFSQSLREELNLSVEQHQKIKGVVLKLNERSKDKWERQAQLLGELEKVGRELGTEIRSMYEEMRELLTHEQRERFDEIRVQIRASKEPPEWAGSDAPPRKDDHRWGVPAGRGGGGPAAGR